jgi:photosystem II stability/assembly factor-like uncharacterized protein
LASVEAAGDRIITAGNLHSSSVTLYSVLLSSADGGRTWREPHRRLRGTGLDRIQFFDSSTGWISGESLFPLPQDPFFLLTTDGGDTWRRQPVFSEAAFGAILQFQFRSKTAGSLVVDRGTGAEGDRYASYETADGGETWAIRQESARAPRLDTPTSPAGWRVRADGRTRSFQIERRSGERWTPVAAFAVSAGACKSPEGDPPAGDSHQ